MMLTDMATLTCQGTADTFGFDAAGDHMLVAVAVTIHTVKTRCQVYIFTSCPLMLFGNSKILIGMTKITSFAGWVARNVKENLVFAVEQAILVGSFDPFIEFRIKFSWMFLRSLLIYLILRAVQTVQMKFGTGFATGFYHFGARSKRMQIGVGRIASAIG